MLNIKSDSVEKAIQEVADTVILPRFRTLKSHDIGFKNGDDPVTIADKEAEIALETLLLPLIEGSKLLGEERFAKNQALLDLFSGDSPVWVVDPLDGTKVFIAGEPFFGLIVSLTKQNETLAAWLYDPLSREFVTAQKGAGAYHKGKRLAVLPPAPLCEMEGVIGTRIVRAFEDCPASHQSRARAPVFHRMLSSCHDYARLVVAEPHFSGQTHQAHFHTWLQTCTPWDNAAGILIHAEAGGYTAHWDGSAFCPSSYGRGILSAPDPESWQALRAFIASFCTMPE